MKKPRILVVENSIDVTGALKSIARTAHDLKDDFDFQFVLPKGSRGRSWIEGKGFTIVHELPMREISRRIPSLISYFPFLIINSIRLNRIVKTQKIDLIHVNDLYNLLPVVLKLFSPACRYVCHIRFMPDRFPKLLFNAWLWLHLRYARRVITVSFAVLRQLPKHSKITVIHNELPVEELYPELVQPIARKSNFTFLYLSNFMTGKGQNFGIEAFARVHNLLPQWKIRFVGGDMGLVKNQMYRRSLQQRANELGIYEKIEWIAFTENVELEYKNADIVLNFSESESFSITCLESLFYGIPVIATDCGGPSEIIDHEITGLLVENRNIEAMVQAMLRLASADEQRGQMGKKGRESVRYKFCIENTSYRIKKEYLAALDH